MAEPQVLVSEAARLSYLWNGSIALAVLLIGSAYLGYRWWKSEGSWFVSERGTSWGLVFWLGAWALLAITYQILHSVTSPSAQGNRDLTLLALAAATDLASLTFVICYATGDRITWRRLVAPYAIGIIVPGLFYGCHEYVLSWWPSSISPLTERLVLISPAMVLGSCTSLLVGWTFLSRWGALAIPMFLVEVLYACAQPAAYLSVFIHNGRFLTYQQDLGTVFEWLMWSKALLGTYGLILFFCTIPNYPDMSRGAFFPSPSEGVSASPLRVRKAAIWVGLTTLAAIIKVLVERFWPK